MKFLGQDFQKLEHEQDRQTETHTHPHTHADETEHIRGYGNGSRDGNRVDRRRSGRVTGRVGLALADR